MDAGKSTLLGVLTHGELDNGRGHARMKLFRHKHEMESGRLVLVNYCCFFARFTNNFLRNVKLF